MSKTFKLTREFHTGTRVFVYEKHFTVTPGSRAVQVQSFHVGHDGELYSTAGEERLDITVARQVWQMELNREGRCIGGFITRARVVEKSV